MSLYNLLNNGVDSNARIALALIGKNPEEFGRFRDAWLTPEGNVEVFTRCGGGNREDYEDVFDAMQAHPGYVRDFDDDFDYTYATFVFRPDEKYSELVDQLKPKDDQPSLADKMNAALDAIKAAPLAEDETEQKSAVEHVEAIVRAAIDAERHEEAKS